MAQEKRKVTYSRTGSETTQSIEDASPMIKAVWNEAHQFGANIVRVRRDENRFGNDTGKTFNSFHHGKVSVYKQKPNPKEEDALYFARKVPVTKANTGMQILEISTNIDIQDTLDTIDDIQYYAETSFLGRLWNRIRYGTPMSITA
jgi:hypothetical protein|tara:strand:+ start:71 stop:508 length:438 start_codon:yes stop_codon:yes gene_type:complete